MSRRVRFLNMYEDNGIDMIDIEYDDTEDPTINFYSKPVLEVPQNHKAVIKEALQLSKIMAMEITLPEDDIVLNKFSEKYENPERPDRITSVEITCFNGTTREQINISSKVGDLTDEEKGIIKKAIMEAKSKF